MINSVCLCITFKCDLECRHCFVEAGPNRTEEMTGSQIEKAIDNSYDSLYRLWFSGGEPTFVMDKLINGLKYAKEKKDKYGYPNKICVQTNGNFAHSEKDAFGMLIQLYKSGANEIDITSNDSFHFEQMDKKDPFMVAEIANRMGVFESITMGGSDYKVVKKFGRAKHISKEELDSYDIKYVNKCVLTESDHVIHPDGSVLPCIYGFSNTLGNIFNTSLKDIINNNKNKEILNNIKHSGIERMFQDYKNSEVNRSDIDICEYCNNMTQKCRMRERDLID